MEKDLQIKYSKALQEVQRERNALRSENEQLKQQLAEKEAENKKLNLLYFGNENTETILTTDKMINHIKISFAVEQLENVKIRIQEDFDYDDLMYWVNKQIQMLKEGK